MPKIEIDYSNTIIYKITCKDPLIKDIYVGHTTNFVQRKHAHKQSCINVKSRNYKLKLYEVIRANGGWKNWKMEIIDLFNLNDQYEARQKEQEYYISLNASLNSNEPCTTKNSTIIKKNIEKKIYYCKVCNTYFLNNKLLEIHNNTKKHITKTQIIIKTLEIPIIMQKTHNKYSCMICHFECSKQSDYNRHILTRKHLNANDANKKTTNVCDKCMHGFKHASSLSRHRKNCNAEKNKLKNQDQNISFIINDEIKSIEPLVNEVTKSENEMKTLTNIVLELVKNNSELQKQHKEFQLQMMEICKTSNNTVNNINSNNHNKTFNLQVFLNEECKDAMNLSEFIESIHLKLPDLLNIGKMGYTEGISKIILKELSETAQNKRPVHCSDIKRETMYIKQENKWEKEGPENIRLKNAIKNIEQKNIALLMNDWKAEHPNHMKSESSENDEYLRLVNQITSGSEDNLNKVIRRIAKDVMINKK